MVQADLTELVSIYVDNPTYSEIVNALKPATEKLERIIGREGYADGARREPSYIAQLIAENIRSTRMTNKCMARYYKKRRVAEAYAPITTLSIVSQ